MDVGRIISKVAASNIVLLDMKLFPANVILTKSMVLKYDFHVDR